MSSSLTDPLFDLAVAWRAATGSSRRRVAIAGVALAWVGALLVARNGTIGARLLAGAVITGSAAVAVGWRVLERERLRHPERIVTRLARPVDPTSADRVLRALSLVGPGGEVRALGTSADLASLHVARAIAQLPSVRIVDRSARTAAHAGTAALVALAGVFVLVAARAWSVLEGANVLAARRGLAPVSMRWLDEVDVVARPPDYLHQNERRGLALASQALPHGTVITVRGTPLHPGRNLLLSDGNSQVPLVDDGSGAVVARWSLAESTSLRVVARLGDVVIPGPEAIEIESVPDRAPTVALEGAPRQVILVHESDDEIAIKYEATDDHGLREVHLVLRSGAREERRVLARLDGETRTDRGGYVLKVRDPFVRKSHAPIDVVVEAKDNDPLTGPKWGASLSIVLVPPDVGEPEALRLDAMRRLRDALVDSLAWRLSNEPPSEPQARRSFIAEETRRAAATDALFGQTLAQVVAGLRVPLRVRATLGAQREATGKAVAHETGRPSPQAHADVVKATERFLLVLDAAIRGLGMHDARDAARQLSEVADDLATGASQGNAEARPNGTTHMDAASLVLSQGAREMKRLGALGRDLSEIIDSDLLRVKRARDGADLMHAELAARDLAARLHQPDPSFGSSGAGPARAGGESGGARGTPGDDASSPDEVNRAFQEAAREVEQLAQDHAGEVGKMEQALAGATSDEEIEQLRQDGKRHAEAIREAARELPSVGTGSDSWTSKGAAARELAEQMARSLEHAHPEDAVQSGSSAISALDEAKKMLQKGGWMEYMTGDRQRRVEGTRGRLEAEEKWAERALEQMRKRAGERARAQLLQGGEEEGKLADRAGELAEQVRDRGSLPEQAVESIHDAERAARQAAEALRQGDAERGLRHQREAQRDLESASEQLRGDDEANSASPADREDGSDGRADSLRGNVPPPGEHKGPEEFRRRVVSGLGQTANGTLKDAVRRYAEGLLR